MNPNELKEETLIHEIEEEYDSMVEPEDGFISTLFLDEDDDEISHPAILIMTNLPNTISMDKDLKEVIEKLNDMKYNESIDYMSKFTKDELMVLTNALVCKNNGGCLTRYIKALLSTYKFDEFNILLDKYNSICSTPEYIIDILMKVYNDEYIDITEYNTIVKMFGYIKLSIHIYKNLCPISINITLTGDCSVSVKELTEMINIKDIETIDCEETISFETLVTLLTNSGYNVNLVAR